MTVAAALNRALSRARDAAVGEDALVEAYAAEIRRAGRESARRFEALLRAPVVAAADWSPPTVADVTAWSVSTARIRGAQRSMLAAIGGQIDDVPGIDFDLTQPVVQKLLDQLGVRAEDFIREGVRGPVAHAIARSWAEGRSVPQTARAIRAAVSNVAGYKAVALARTDLIGLSNGAGQWAVEQLNKGAEKNGQPKPIQTKTWTSAGDSRVRDTHQEADGQTVPVSQTYRVGGASLRYPGDPFGPHDEVVNCRCVEIFNEEAAPSPPPPPTEEPKEARDDFSKLVTLPGPQDLRWNAPATARTRERLTHAVETFAKGLRGGAPKTLAEKLDPVGGSLKVKLAPNLDAHGEYAFMGNSPMQIQIRPGGPHLANTTWHELGHFLDHQALSKEPGFASVAAPTNEMLAFRRAVDASAQARVLAEQRAAPALKINYREGGPPEDRFIPNSSGARKYIDYLNDPREQWARAFAQYFARKFGDLDANEELDALIDADWNPDRAALVPGQWRDDDFGPISDAVENVLRGAGLLDDRGLTAAFWRYLAKIDPRGLSPVERREPLARLFRREEELRPEVVEDLVVRPAVLAKLFGHDHGSSVPRRAADGPPVYPDDASPSRRNP